MGESSAAIIHLRNLKKISNLNIGFFQAFLSKGAGFPLSTLPDFVLTIGSRFVEGAVCIC